MIIILNSLSTSPSRSQLQLRQTQKRHAHHPGDGRLWGWQLGFSQEGAAVIKATKFDRRSSEIDTDDLISLRHAQKRKNTWNWLCQVP